MLLPQGLHVQPGILHQPLLSAQRHHLFLLLWTVPQWLSGVQIADLNLLAARVLLVPASVQDEKRASPDIWDHAG